MQDVCIICTEKVNSRELTYYIEDAKTFDLIEMDFKTEDTAEDYCKNHNLNIVEYGYN